MEKEDERKMQELLGELRKKVAKGERKLKRSERKTKVKEHRERKIREHNERLKESETVRQPENDEESIFKTRDTNYVSSTVSNSELSDRGSMVCRSNKRQSQTKTGNSYSGQRVLRLQEGGSKEQTLFKDVIPDSNSKYKLSRSKLVIDDSLVVSTNEKNESTRIYFTISPNIETLGKEIKKDKISETYSVTGPGKEIISENDKAVQDSSGEVSSRSSLESNGGRKQLSLKRKRKRTKESPVGSKVMTKENQYEEGCTEPVICIDESSKDDDDAREEFSVKKEVFINSEGNKQISPEISVSNAEPSAINDSVKRDRSKRQRTQNISPRLERKLRSPCVVSQRDYNSDRNSMDSMLSRQLKHQHSNAIGMTIKSNKLIILSSALQYLIDDAKRTTAVKDFELPTQSYGTQLTKKYNNVQKELSDVKIDSCTLLRNEDLKSTSRSRSQDRQSLSLISVKGEESQASSTTECGNTCNSLCEKSQALTVQDSNGMIPTEESPFSSSTQSSQSTLCDDAETICRKSSRRKKRGRGRRRASLQTNFPKKLDTSSINSTELNKTDEGQLDAETLQSANSNTCLPDSEPKEDMKSEVEDTCTVLSSNSQILPSSPTLFSQPDDILSPSACKVHGNQEIQDLLAVNGARKELEENQNDFQNDFGDDLLHLSSFQVATDDVILMIKPVVMQQGKKSADLVTCFTQKSLSIWLPDDFDLTCLQRWDFPVDFVAISGDVYARKGNQVLIVILLENGEHKLLSSAVFEQDKAHSLTELRRWDSTSKYSQLVCCDSGVEFLVSSCSLEGSSITKYILGIDGKEVSSSHDLAAVSGVFDSISMVQNLPTAVMGHMSTGVIHIWNHVLGTLLVSVSISSTWPYNSFLTSPCAEKGYIVCCLISRVPAKSAGCHMVINPTNHKSMILNTFHCENWKGCNMATGLDDSVAAMDLSGYVLTWSRYNGALTSRSYKPGLTMLCTTKHYVLTAMDSCVHVFKR